MDPVTRQIVANGLTFTVDEMGSGDAVALCLHGFPESRYAWRHQLPQLASRGWRVVAPDLRGYGESDRPHGRQAYRLDRLVADAAGLFDALGARRRLLIGHDWGGLIAWAFAMRPPRALDGLIIMNAPHPAVFRRVLRRSWAQRRRSWYVALFQLPVVPEVLFTVGRAYLIGEAFRAMAVDKSAFPSEVLDHYRQNALRPGAMTAMLNYYRANLTTLGDASRNPPMIETPTLLIWGEEDRALGLDLTVGYEPYVKDLQLVRLKDVSHWVQQEAPEVVNAGLQAWLDARAI